MLRNKVFTTLQKTYDDSYLSCSTAVYYESQGDEVEAIRHWRSALQQIYDHHANRSIPGYGPQTDTEKALVDALKELELQCKERIDLLEALRVSRREEGRPDPTPRLSKPTGSTESPRGKGTIGMGTIPAVTYSELSRPTLPPRPSLPIRSVSEAPIAGPRLLPLPPDQPSTFGTSSGRSLSPNPPSKSDKGRRSASPEKHTMRTTLRSSKPGDKSSGTSRKSPRPAAEGPSKAASLAWSALSSRDRHTRQGANDVPSVSSSNTRQLPEQITRVRGGNQWDSHSRRLVVPKDPDVTTNGTSPGFGRHSDEYMNKPSFLSVSAASSALNVTAQNDTPNESTSNRNGPCLATRAAQSISTVTKDELSNSSSTLDDSGDRSERKTRQDSITRRKAIAKRATGTSTSSRTNHNLAGRSRHQDKPKVRKSSISSASEADASTSKLRSPNTRASPSKTSNVNNNMKSKVGATTANEEDTTSPSSDEEPSVDLAWKKKQAAILKSLPPGIDEAAAKQILNDIIVQGDEVHWGDVAGLEIAKNALRETVVYPFLRPDLFMGLREPARGMLLFGPPGTGKTMLARAVATESKSTFFSISASSLTSKYLGESEKLVRALFGLARCLAPSIIFVDEIDSLLSQRSGSGEHEATRRIKTEFLIQWSDLQRAAAGRETTERDRERGDANRVLVLAATNLPWAIDEAARRRFVRRQYIPLPEPSTREVQLRTLLGQQKHGLTSADIKRLVNLTDGFSGSDITALAKDAAMGPLRSLGEALLHMTMDEIRPIALVDFEASLATIRPSVSKSGLKEYEDWAREFGERGG